jgi:uncharacterized protein YecE (DUF72 family)
MAPIHVGIGGWNFPPWRGSFYPAGLPQTQELGYASRHVTSIEINATFYGSQKPASFRKWREETPEGFVFSVKGPRYATSRRDLGGAAESVERFLLTGVLELGPKLGPILWQLPPTRAFDPEQLGPFLACLPHHHAGVALRHAVEARHPSFAHPGWMALLRDAGVAHAIVDSDKHVLQADVTAPFIYARLERNSLDEPDGYAGPSLDGWAARIRGWAAGVPVADLPTAGPIGTDSVPRECFAYFISGDKVRAPASAMAMLDRLRDLS